MYITVCIIRHLSTISTDVQTHYICLRACTRMGIYKSATCIVSLGLVLHICIVHVGIYR